MMVRGAASLAAAIVMGGVVGAPAAPYFATAQSGAESPVLVSGRITVAPAQRERDRVVGSGTILRPEVRPATRQRPSDYYQPPARDGEPFYHYRRTTPSVSAPAYQRHHR